MGWIFTHKPQKMTVREFFEKEFNYEKDNGRYGRVIDCAAYLNVAYLAYEIGKVGDPDSKEIIAIICLLSYRPKDYYNFGYKDIGESMGPYYYDCPERILKLLTPTSDPTANEWRQECWRRVRARKARPRLRKGMVIKFEKKIIFQNGVQEDTFRVLNPKRLLFEDVSGWHRYKLRRWILQNYKWKQVRS